MRHNHALIYFGGAYPVNTQESSPSHPAAPGQTPLAARLVSCLRTRRTYLLIYQEYRKQQPKPEFMALLDALIDETQEAIAAVSTQVRRADRSPLAVGINEKLLTQGAGRKGVLSKLNFMLVGSSRALEWYASQQAANDPAEVQAMWQQLSALESQHLQAIKGLLASLEQPGSRPEPPEGA